MICPKCKSENIETNTDTDETLDWNGNLVKSHTFIIDAFCKDCEYDLTDKEIEREEKRILKENY